MGSNLSRWSQYLSRKAFGARSVTWLVPLTIVLILLLALQSRGILFPKQDQTWAAIQQQGQWRIGVDPSFPPFEFLDESGQPIGFDLDLASQIAEQWGAEVQVVAIGFDSLIDAVQTDQVDSIISALPYDPRLTKDVLYSSPYFDAGISIAVRADSKWLADDSLDTLIIPEDAPQFLSGKRVGVEWGGMGDMLGRRFQRETTGIELVPFETPQETVSALQLDPTIDAILVDNITLQQMRESASVVGIGPILESNPYVIASPIDATVLAQKIDDALDQLQQTGIIQQLSHEWFQTIQE